MTGKFNFLKNLIYTFGCLVVFIIPVVAILAIWKFEFKDVKNILGEFNFRQDENTGTLNYNFPVQAGEDAILSDISIDTNNSAPLTQTTKKAVWLDIPSANISGSIVYGSDGEILLKQGFWHYPPTYYPGAKGVSVIFGHRRHHLPPLKDTFYNLDKVAIGDKITVKLENGQLIEYSVIRIEIVNPEDLNNAINDDPNRYLLKLITCTPLGTDKQRLVVTAERYI